MNSGALAEFLTLSRNLVCDEIRRMDYDVSPCGECVPCQMLALRRAAEEEAQGLGVAI
jgi:hypothetical protein